MGTNPFRFVLVMRYPLYPQSMRSKSVNHFGRFPRDNDDKVVLSAIVHEENIDSWTRRLCEREGDNG